MTHEQIQQMFSEESDDDELYVGSTPGEFIGPKNKSKYMSGYMDLFSL